MNGLGQKYIKSLTPDGPEWGKQHIYGKAAGFETAGLQERLLRRAVFLYWERRPDPRETREVGLPA